MTPATRSSRQRYRAYRERVKRRGNDMSVVGDVAAASPVTAEDGRHKRRQRTRSFGALFGSFWELLGDHRALLFPILAALSVNKLLTLAPLYGTKLVFDGVLGERSMTTSLPRWIPLPEGRRELLTFVVIAMVVLSAAAEAVGLWSRWQATKMTKRVQVSVRKRVFDHAVRLPLHRVYDLKSGGVTSILREDAGGIAELIFSMLYNPFGAIVQLLGILFILAFVDWRLLVGSLAVLPIVWFTHRTWIGRVRPIFRDIRSTRQQIDSHATEAFGGMRVVRSFSRQQAEAATFTRSGHLMARQEIFAWWWMRGVDLAWSILVPFASALLLYFGGMKVVSDMEKISAGLLSPDDALSVGDLAMFLVYLASMLAPIAALAASATSLQNSLSGLDRVLDLLAEPLEMVASPDAVHVTREDSAGRITMRDVSFAYAGSSTPVLQEINLDVRPGEMIALVGPSGAGKTTLCNLVARFYDPTGGSVMLDGVDLRTITAQSYRRLLGIVEQDTFLFDGTIAENIAYGRRGATTAQIEDSARLANAHDFVTKLTLGYETLIGERGVKLSGGQRQRLTIARAILADPKILILDEATSNLDTESERLIQGSLRTLMAGRTSFVIAHRLSTIAHADRILVLENGRIVEQGRHEELMSESGRYRAMVDLQTSPPPPPTPTRAPESDREVEAYAD